MNNSFHTISNVLFVPNSKTKLISIGQLQEKGYGVTIKGGVCIIFDEQLGLITEAHMTKNRMFPLRLNTTSSQLCFYTRLKEEGW